MAGALSSGHALSQVSHPRFHSSKNYASFIKKDVSDYIGMWIVLKNGRVVEKDKTPKGLNRKIKHRKDLEELTISKIPDKNQVLIL